MSQEPSRITICSDPPYEGEQATVCFNFDGYGPDQVKLEWNWTPDTIPGGSETVTRDASCFDLQIPVGALVIEILDSSGKSEPMARAIAPPPPPAQ